MTSREQDLADHINRKYAEAVLPLLAERNAIDRRLLEIGNCMDARKPVLMSLSDQACLVSKRSEINKQIRAYQSQEQEKQWIREYEEGACMT